MTYILGLSAYYHDSAASLLLDGEIIAAAQEERFSRKRHDAAFPKSAIQFCLQQACIALTDIDYIVFYDKPFLSLSACWKRISQLRLLACQRLLRRCRYG